MFPPPSGQGQFASTTAIGRRPSQLGKLPAALWLVQYFGEVSNQTEISFFSAVYDRCLQLESPKNKAFFDAMATEWNQLRWQLSEDLPALALKIRGKTSTQLRKFHATLLDRHEMPYFTASMLEGEAALQQRIAAVASSSASPAGVKVAIPPLRDPSAVGIPTPTGLPAAPSSSASQSVQQSHTSPAPRQMKNPGGRGIAKACRLCSHSHPFKRMERVQKRDHYCFCWHGQHGLRLPASAPASARCPANAGGGQMCKCILCAATGLIRS